SPPCPPTLSLAGAPCPAPFAWLTRCRSFASAARMLLALELGLALLEERLRPFAPVFGARDQAEDRRLVVLRLRERHLQPLVHRLEDVAHGDRRLRGQRRRQLPRFRHQLSGRDAETHQAEP